MKDIKIMVLLIILFGITFIIDHLGLGIANKNLNYWIYHIIFILNSAIRFEIALLVILAVCKVDFITQIRAHKILTGLQFLITILIFTLINNSLYFSLLPGKLLSTINEMRYLITMIYFLLSIMAFKYKSR